MRRIQTWKLMTQGGFKAIVVGERGASRKIQKNFNGFGGEVWEKNDKNITLFFLNSFFIPTFRQLYSSKEGKEKRKKRKGELS